MDIQTRKEQQASIITITGRLDAVTAQEYEKYARNLIDGGEICLVVDLGGLDYISSAGLRSLLVTAKLLKGKGGKIRCANVNGPVKEVFTISGFGAVFPIDESTSASLAALS
jgi:anti-anti-sigma factor